MLIQKYFTILTVSIITVIIIPQYSKPEKKQSRAVTDRVKLASHELQCKIYEKEFETAEGAEIRRDKKMNINNITDKIIGCAIKIHKKLGPGFLESVYQAALAYELKQININFEKEKELPVKYEDILLDIGFRCDFLIEKCVIVECKAVKELTHIDEAQLINYLKITNLQVGLLINFNSIKLIKGLKRIVNNYIV